MHGVMTLKFSLTSSLNNFDLHSPCCKLIILKSIFVKVAIIFSLSFVVLCFVSSSLSDSIQGLFPVHACIFITDFQAILSLTSSLLTFYSSKPTLIALYYYFLGRYPNFRHYRQKLCCIHFRWPNLDNLTTFSWYSIKFNFKGLQQQSYPLSWSDNIVFFNWPRLTSILYGTTHTSGI